MLYVLWSWPASIGTHALRCEYRLKSHFNDNRQSLYYANNTKMVVGEQTPICYRTALKPRGDSGLEQ